MVALRCFRPTRATSRPTRWSPQVHPKRITSPPSAEACERGSEAVRQLVHPPQRQPAPHIPARGSRRTPPRSGASRSPLAARAPPGRCDHSAAVGSRGVPDLGVVVTDACRCPRYQWRRARTEHRLRLRDREGTAGLREAPRAAHRTGGREAAGNRPRSALRHPVLQPRRSRRAGNDPVPAELRALPEGGAGAVRHRQLGPSRRRQQHRRELLRDPRAGRAVEHDPPGRFPGRREGAQGMDRLLS